MEGSSNNCGFCGKVFGRRVSLLSHQKVCHKVKQEPQSSCSDEDWDEDFEENTTLDQRHSKIKVLSISCNLCGKNFKQKKALQSHVKMCNAANMEGEGDSVERGDELDKSFQSSELLGIKSEVNLGENMDQDLANVSNAFDDTPDASNDEREYEMNESMSPIELRKTYNKYTRSLKLQVIAYAKIHGKNSASRKFNVPNTSVRRWVSHEKQLKQEPRMKDGRELRAARTVPSTKLEFDLKNWLLVKHKAGEVLTKDMITNKAMIVAKERNLSKFNATRPWYFAFLNRQKLDSIVDVFIPDGETPDIPGATTIKEMTCDKCGLIFKYRPSLRSHRQVCMSVIDKELLKRSKLRSPDEVFEEMQETFNDREDTTNFNNKNRKHKMYTKEFKLKVIREAKLLGNRNVERRFGVRESLIRRWRDSENTLRSLPSTWNTLPRKLSQVHLIKKKYKTQNKLKVQKSMVDKSIGPKERRNYKIYTCNICKANFKVKTVFECHVENCSAEVVSNEEAKGQELQVKLAQIKEKNKTKKKSTFPAGFKLQLIQEAKLKGTSYVAKKYKLHIGTVNRWRHREEILQKLPKEKVICLGGSKFPLLESRLKEWMQANARLGKVLIRSLIKRQACKFSEDMKLYDFMCSDSWLKKFFQRNQIGDMVRVITNVVPYICETCGKSLKTDIEFENHMLRCNPRCIDYVTIEIPAGMQPTGDKAVELSQAQSLDLLSSDMQNQNCGEGYDDDVDDDEEDNGVDLSHSTPLPHQAGLVDIKQEVISPDEKSALQSEPPSLDSSIEGRANDRLASCGRLNGPQLDRIFEFLDQARIAPTPSPCDKHHPGNDFIVKKQNVAFKIDHDINCSGISVELPDDEEDDSDDDTIDMVDHDTDYFPESPSDSEKNSKVKEIQAAAKAKVGPFTCKICARQFNFKVTFEKHMKYHESQTKYDCHICEETFAFKMQLLNHLETHKRSKRPGTDVDGGQTTKNGDHEHMCERCGRYLKGGPSYRYHMKLHFREDQANCAECNENVLCSEHQEEYRVHLDSTLTRPVSFKLKLVDLVKQGENKSEVARKYDVALNSLRKWINSEDKLRSAEAKSMENFSLKRKFDCPDVESRLVSYLLNLHYAGMGVTNDDFQEEARKIADEVGNKTFKPTIPWLASFKERFKDVVPAEVFTKKKAVRGSRKSYSIVEKAQIVAKTEELGVGKAARQLGLPRSTIRKWVKQKRFIFDQVYNSSNNVQYQAVSNDQLVQNYEETVVNDGSYLIGDLLNEGY